MNENVVTELIALMSSRPTDAEVVETLRLLSERQDELLGLLRNVKQTKALILSEFRASIDHVGNVPQGNMVH